MRKRSVLVLGAARHQVFVLTAIRQLGCKVVAVDRNPDAAGQHIADLFEAVDISDVESVIGVARHYEVDAILPLNDFGVVTAAAVAERIGLVGISPTAAEKVTNKARMRETWKQIGLPSPRFLVVRTIEEAYEAVKQLNSWPLMFKPADSRGGGSRGVSRVSCYEEIPAALSFAQSFYENQDVVIEEYLDGLEHSVETVTYGGETYVLAVSDKYKTPPPYRVDKSVLYPTQVNGEALEAIHDTVKRAVRSLGITVGAVHVELCTTSQGPMLFEVGARFGGGHTSDPIVRYVTGINVVQEVVRILLGEKPLRLTPKQMLRGCVYRFLMPSPGVLEDVSGIEEIRQWPGILDCGLWVSPGSRIRPVRTGLDRAGFIIAAGEDRQAALELADRAEKEVVFMVRSTD